MIATSLVLAIGIATVAEAPQGPRPGAPPPAADAFLIVPLSVHILTSRDLKLADCKLRDADITRIVGKLNTIWSKAGIYFGLEAIVREAAAQTERFRQVVERKKGEIAVLDYLTLLPKPSRGIDGFHAFFFHELPMNGSALVNDIVIVTEQAQLKPVEGGIDEPIPRMLGFTIGVALGLEARRAPETSLLALGTTGTDLSAGDVDRARRVANTVTGVMTIDEAQKAAAAAQAAGQADRAKRLRSWLAEIAAVKKANAKGRRARNDPPASSKVNSDCGPQPAWCWLGLLLPGASVHCRIAGSIPRASREISTCMHTSRTIRRSPGECARL
jgi:hypothetical protein